MGRIRRMDYEMIGRLYESLYNTIILGRMYDTPNGHISKVLVKVGVQARPRWVRITPLSFRQLDRELQQYILSDDERIQAYLQAIEGYLSRVDVMKEIQSALSRDSDLRKKVG